MKATVAERGQVTIPKELRDKLGIQAGTVLTFSAENGKLIVKNWALTTRLHAPTAASDAGSRATA